VAQKDQINEEPLKARGPPREQIGDEIKRELGASANRNRRPDEYAPDEGEQRQLLALQEGRAEEVAHADLDEDQERDEGQHGPPARTAGPFHAAPGTP
jgi:hypothetical protein